MKRGDISLLYVDEAHFHRDMDPGYSWGRKGQRIRRGSSGAKLSERLNWYGAYDFAAGRCLLWQDGKCNGHNTVRFLELVVLWHKSKDKKLVIIWDNAPCHTALLVQHAAARLKIELVPLPGYSPDLNAIEGLWDWMRDEVTRGHYHASLSELEAACQKFIALINQDPTALVDRLWPKFELDPQDELLFSD